MLIFKEYLVSYPLPPPPPQLVLDGNLFSHSVVPTLCRVQSMWGQWEPDPMTMSPGKAHCSTYQVPSS